MSGLSVTVNPHLYIIRIIVVTIVIVLLSRAVVKETQMKEILVMHSTVNYISYCGFVNVFYHHLENF